MTVIDISNWQGDITGPVFRDWVAAGVTRVIIKAGGGDDGVYKSSHHDQQAGAAFGILPRDRYWFNGEDGSIEAQADFFANILNGTAGVALAPGEEVWWDIEAEQGETRWTPAQTVTAANRLATHGFGPKGTGAYMSSSVTQAENWQPVVDLGLDLWVAQYGPNDGSAHGAPSIAYWKSYKYWQFTSVGHEPGYGGNLDVSTGDGSAVIVIASSPTGYNASSWSTATIQQALNETQGAGLIVDDDYGPATTAAVHAFEVKYGLMVDIGIAGPQVVGKLAQLTGASTASATRAGLLVDGAEGRLTTAAEQRALQAHNISVGPAGADGIRGHDTIYAEQTLTGAGRDGEDGPDTAGHLQQYLHNLGAKYAAICGPVDRDKGPNTIKALQTALNDGVF